MFPAKFDYAAPTSLDEALRLLQRNEDAKLLAGGHSLLPAMKLRLAQPSLLVDLSKIGGLAYVRQEGGGLAIGAMTTYHQVAREAGQSLPVLAQTIELVGDPQVRNRGTIGGSLAHADPAADLPAVMIALNATLVARGAGGERTIPVDEFFTGLFETALQPDEILTEIRLPALNGKASYQKLPNPASRYALVGVAAANHGGTVRVGITGAGTNAVRATAVEQALGGNLSAENIAAAAEKAGEGIDFIGDIHGSESYRQAMVKVLTRRALSAIA